MPPLPPNFQFPPPQKGGAGAGAGQGGFPPGGPPAPQQQAQMPFQGQSGGGNAYSDRR
jgi:hypothetical protein